MVGCVIPNAPPTRNEDKPSSLAVKTTPRAKKKEKSDMNEKLAQALQKGKEIAVPLCIKGKELALTGYAKGNELMDKVSFLQKPLHKKIVWGVLGVVLIWIMLPSGGGSGSNGLVLKEADFKAESSSKEMFYVKNGKDDGLKEVVPNLKKLPKGLSLHTLCGGFNPELEEERHTKGVAYLNDEGNTFYHCVVVHVGDGFVIAEPNDKGMYGDYCGYIETDDEYVDGQQLKTGFYVLTGKKKVPLPRGASRSMYAFKRMDAKSNKLALDTLDYNIKAEEAAKEENARRFEARKEKRNKDIGKAFAKESKRFVIRDMKEQLHLPPELKSKSDCFIVQTRTDMNPMLLGESVQVTSIEWVNGHWMSLKELEAMVKGGKWEELVKRTGFMSDECPPDDYASNLVAYLMQGRRTLSSSNARLGKSHFDYSYITIVPGWKEIETAATLNDAGGAFRISVRLCDDLYIVPAEDKDYFAKFSDPKEFVGEFAKKYGK